MQRNEPGPGEPLVPELREYEEAYRAAQREARELAGSLSDAQFNWQPEPGRWSIAECLDHLRVTGEQIVQRLDPAIDLARQRGRFAPGPFRYGWLSRFWIRANSPDPGPRSRVKSPGIFRPTPSQPVERVLPAFLALQDGLIERLRRANGLDLRLRVRSPVTPLLRVSLGAWLAATAAHQQRHLGQARRVREDPRFPAA